MRGASWLKRRAAAAGAVALVALLAVPPVIPDGGGAASPAVVFSELLPRPDLDAGQVEYIELWNTGDAPVQLQGWTVRDRNNASFTFPAWTLDPGGRVVVWSGPGANHTPEGPRWKLNYAWNSNGDTATLKDPEGNVVDWMAYGSGRAASPPPGFSNASMPDAPARGVALILEEGVWIEGEPAPGRAPGDGAGTATVMVQDVPPRVRLLDPPERARAGTVFPLAFAVEEDNGDPVTWRVRSPEGVLAEGAGTGEHVVQVTPPTGAGAWLLEVHAWDPQGNEGADDVVVQVRDRDLRVAMPGSGAVRFPDLPPGLSNVTATDPFTLVNEGDGPLRPRIDVSPLRNGEASIPVDGNLRVGVRPQGSGADPSWTLYGGPYTELPELAPGEQWDVVLELVQVPVPLPAGAYGTTFTVVEASP